MVALEVMSFACPFLVAGAWAAMRRRGRPALMAPALYAALVGTGGLMIPAAERQLPFPVCALGIAFALAWAGLIDFIRPDQGHGPEDHNDDGGGGGRPPPPAAPAAARVRSARSRVVAGFRAGVLGTCQRGCGQPRRRDCWLPARRRLTANSDRT